MSATVPLRHLRRAAIVLVLALALLTLWLRQDSTVGAVSASGSPVSGLCVGTEGPIKGDNTQKGREGTYRVTSVSHGITSPRDAASGQATGKRQHKPFVFTTNVSQATPQLIETQVKGLFMPRCTFKFWKTGPNGNERNYYKIELKDVLVSSYSMAGRPGGADTTTFELAYQKIEWTFVDGGVTAEDDWQPVS